MARHPNVPPIIETHDHEYRGSGVESTVAVAGHPLHPVIVTFPIAFLRPPRERPRVLPDPGSALGAGIAVALGAGIAGECSPQSPA